MTKFVTYRRVSTQEQGRSGLGLEAQQQILDHFLNDQDVIGEFTEVMSGAKDDRPELKQAIDLCLAENAFLAVAKTDRLSRDTVYTLKVHEQLDGRLWAGDIPTEPGAKMDRFMLTLIAAMAERERLLIGLRTSQALQAKIRRGDPDYNPTANLYGGIGNPEYGPDYNPEDSIASKEYDPERADRNRAKGPGAHRKKAMAETRKELEHIKNWRGSGVIKLDGGEEMAATWQNIADRLNELGYTTRRGKEFAPTTAWRIYQRNGAGA